MRLLTLCISLIFLSKSAMAGGYAGALERVLMYYAYQIDQLQPEDQQTLGFKCAKLGGAGGWDYKAKRCPVGGTGQDEVKWRSCAELMKVPRCNFAQLNEMIGGFQKKNNIVGDDPDTRTPNVKNTAIAFYRFSVGRPGKKGAPKNKVTNAPTQNFLKDANGEYNSFIHEVGNRVAACGQYRANNAELFAGFADASDQIVEARRGDHGPYLIDHFNREDYIRDGSMTLAVENVGDGHSPVLDGKDAEAGQSRTWQTVNYGSTLASSRLSDKDSIDKVMGTLKDFYSTDKDANEHREVLKSFNGLANKARSC